MTNSIIPLTNILLTLEKAPRIGDPATDSETGCYIAISCLLADKLHDDLKALILELLGDEPE